MSSNNGSSFYPIDSSSMTWKVGDVELSIPSPNLIGKIIFDSSPSSSTTSYEFFVSNLKHLWHCAKVEITDQVIRQQCPILAHNTPAKIASVLSEALHSPQARWEGLLLTASNSSPFEAQIYAADLQPSSSYEWVRLSIRKPIAAGFHGRPDLDFTWSFDLTPLPTEQFYQHITWPQITLLQQIQNMTAELITNAETMQRRLNQCQEWIRDCGLPPDAGGGLLRFDVRWDKQDWLDTQKDRFVKLLEHESTEPLNSKLISGAYEREEFQTLHELAASVQLKVKKASVKSTRGQLNGETASDQELGTRQKGEKEESAQAALERKRMAREADRLRELEKQAAKKKVKSLW